MPVSQTDWHHALVPAPRAQRSRPALTGAFARSGGAVDVREYPPAFVLARPAPDAVHSAAWRGRSPGTRPWTWHRVQTDFARLSCSDRRAYRRQREEELGVGGQAGASRAPVGMCVSHSASVLLRRVIPASRGLRRHRVHGHRSPARACRVYSRQLPVIPTLAGRPWLPRWAGRFLPARRAGRSAFSARAGRSGLSRRAGRSGLSPTRSTIMVMSSIRSPARELEQGPTHRGFELVGMAPGQAGELVTEPGLEVGPVAAPAPA